LGERTDRDKVLKKVRKSLLQQDVYFKSNLDLDSTVFTKEKDRLIIEFAQNFIANNGRFVYCNNEFQFIDKILNASASSGWESLVCLNDYWINAFKDCGLKIHSDIEGIPSADYSITGCEGIIARTGSIVISSAMDKSRNISVYPPVNIIFAYKNQLFFDLKDFFTANSNITSASSMVSIVSGPSRTADIEKTLVLGAHGPREVYLFYIDEDKIG
jgi:L-lactate dehydrogenase complex protein LldG